MAQTYPNLTGGVPPQKPTTSNRYIKPVLIIAFVVVIIITIIARSSIDNPIIGDWKLSRDSDNYVNTMLSYYNSNIIFNITKDEISITTLGNTVSFDVKFVHSGGRWYIVTEGNRDEVIILDENTIELTFEAPFGTGDMTLERIQPK
ncbi:MAG: hypothetical protein LBF38_01560 [Deltaproteobacteria bacterium]|jgi:hypothetical protein|nr:hypothetical protein [Deltaproteobacteria bacterium]